MKRIIDIIWTVLQEISQARQKQSGHSWDY